MIRGEHYGKVGERAVFQLYLRTGRRMIAADAVGLEFKFNPYHDPRNGQFTFGPGGSSLLRHRGDSAMEGRLSAQAVSMRQGARSKIAASAASRLLAVNAEVTPSKNDTVTRNRPSTSNLMNNNVPYIPYLSSIHNEILHISSKYPADIGTNEWTFDDIARWKLSGENIYNFKSQWVHGYRKAISAAADRFDLPRRLVAGVAFNEVGGDPMVIDDIAYSLRDGKSRDRTSFGNVSIQIRRAAESLGYDLSNDLSLSQRRVIIESLRDPKANIFIAAKHLSDLRDIEYNGISASKLNKFQVEIIASRYNRGPDLSLSEIQKNTSYGKAITKRWEYLGKIIE